MANIAKIFVIIVTYKGHLWYERCFKSLRDSELPVQIIVIDNASNDGTVEYIRAHFPDIHLIESKENLGFGRANNLGMRYALDNGADYVFLLNQDAWIEPNTIGELVRIAEK
jgi:GT2 family glycosyltransferase